VQKPKTTKLNVREDRPTALTSSAHGSNLDAIGFNLNFLSLRSPKLAVEIIKLYSEAHSVQENDPNAPDEDLELFNDELTRLMTGAEVDSEE
jgi:hypothetical protein